MQDYGTEVRKAYYNALDGNITYNALPVPVVDEKLDETTENDVYVLLGEQSENDRSNKTYFAADVNLNIYIIQRTEATVTKEAVENISNQISTIIKPTVRSHGLTIASPFKIVLVKLDRGSTQPVRKDVGEQFLVNKSLIFLNHISQ